MLPDQLLFIILYQTRGVITVAKEKINEKGIPYGSREHMPLCFHNLSLSRMIIGTNWMAGYSHRGPAADRMIVERHSRPDGIVAMLEKFLEYGVDTMMAPFLSQPVILQAVRETVNQIIHSAKKPVMTIKPMAAGRKGTIRKPETVNKENSEQ